jgi:hypothetical protein
MEARPARLRAQARHAALTAAGEAAEAARAVMYVRPGDASSKLQPAMMTFRIRARPGSTAADRAQPVLQDQFIMSQHQEMIVVIMD